MVVLNAAVAYRLLARECRTAGGNGMIRIRGRRGSSKGFTPGIFFGPPLVAITDHGEDEVEGARFSFGAPRCR